jgi:hypothetical protein
MTGSGATRSPRSQPSSASPALRSTATCPSRRPHRILKATRIGTPNGGSIALLGPADATDRSTSARPPTGRLAPTAVPLALLPTLPVLNGIADLIPPFVLNDFGQSPTTTTNL